MCFFLHRQAIPTFLPAVLCRHTGLSKNVFYYQIRVQVPLTGGAPPLIVYGGYITSNRQIAL